MHVVRPADTTSTFESAVLEAKDVLKRIRSLRSCIASILNSPSELVRMTADEQAALSPVMNRLMHSLSTEASYFKHDVRVLAAVVKSVAHPKVRDATVPRRCRCAWRLQLRMCTGNRDTHLYYRHVRKQLVGDGSKVPDTHPDFYTLVPSEVPLDEALNIGTYVQLRDYWYGVVRRSHPFPLARTLHRWLSKQTYNRFRRGNHV